MPEIISRKEAIERGLKRYFRGVACRRGHLSEQYISGACIECHRAERQSVCRECEECGTQFVTKERLKTMCSKKCSQTRFQRKKAAERFNRAIAISQKCVVCELSFNSFHRRKVCSEGCKKSLMRTNKQRFCDKNPGYMQRINDQRAAVVRALRELGVDIYQKEHS